MKKLIYIGLLIFIFACGKKMESTKPTHEKEVQPVYYLENDLHSNFNLHGPVHTLSELYMDRQTNSILKFMTGFHIRPLDEMIGYSRGYTEFNSKGEIILNYGFKDSLGYVNDVRGTLCTLWFYNRDSIPNNVKFKNEYSRNIFYPGLLKQNNALTTFGPTSKIKDVNLDSLFFHNYSYRVEGNKILKRLSQSLLPNKTIPGYYEEVVAYNYDSINQISREDYSFYEKINDERIFFKDGRRYHDILVGSNDKMHKIFSYDIRGNIANMEMFINDNYVFEEKYHYDEKGNLTSKERIDPRHRYHLLNRSYRTIYYYDKNGNIIQVDENNEDGELKQQLWIDYYEFDEYNNWQRCEMFLNNTHSGEPQLTGYRRMTYYEK